MIKMEGNYKEYDEELDEISKDAIRVIRNWLWKNEYDSKDTSGEYRNGLTDIVAYPKGENLCSDKSNAFFVEVEKRVKWWKQGEFPYKTLHILERKGKYLELERPVLFISVCGNLKKAIAVEGEKIKNRKLTWENKTKEKFWDIPIDDCLLIDL